MCIQTKYWTGALTALWFALAGVAQAAQLELGQVIFDDLSGLNFLDGASSVATSPDGQHVYVASRDGDTIAIFSRNRSTGALTFLENQVDDVGGVNGLDNANSVALSPDGHHVYAASDGDSAIAVFSRNSSTGALTFAEAQSDGVDGVIGIAGARSVTVSPDGQHVYAAGATDDAVVVFSRNGTTGALNFVETQTNGTNGVDGIDGARWVTVSPDGQAVYVVGSADAIAIFSRNSSTGGLTFVETQDNEVDGVFGLDGVNSVALSPDGQHLYSTSSTDNSIALFSTQEFSFGEVLFDGEAGIDGLDGTTNILVSPDGRHVYTAAFAENAIGVFALDEENSALSLVEIERNDQAGVVSMNGPFNLAMSADGRDLYVAAPNSSGLVHFSRSSATGELTFEETLSDASVGSGLFGAIAVAVSPDGAHVYVGLAAENAVSVWSRDPMTGALTFVQIRSELDGIVTGLAAIRNLQISPDGLDLYVAAAGNAGSMGARFRRVPTTGALLFQGEIPRGFGNNNNILVPPVVITQDGLNVYMADSSGIVGYTRSPSSGELTRFLPGSSSDGEFGDLALSADGRHLLGVDRPESAFFVWNRDATTGAILRSQREFDGLAGVSGLGLAAAVAITPSGGHAFVAGTGDDSLALFVPEPDARLGLGAGLVAIGLFASRRGRRPAASVSA